MKFTVSKLDVARRQLETAIRLYFVGGDPVAMHTLTAAAYNVLRDISKQKGIDPVFIKGQMLELVKPQYKKLFANKANEAENFFKHADRDHASTLDFNPEMTELHLIDACIQYRKLTGEEPPLVLLYRVWFTAHHPNFFILPDELKEYFRLNAASIAGMERSEYLKMTLPIAKQTCARKDQTPVLPTQNT